MDEFTEVREIGLNKNSGIVTVVGSDSSDNEITAQLDVKSHPMIDIQFKTPPFEFLTILELKLDKNRGAATIVGTILPDKESEYLKKYNHNIMITIDNSEEKILFSGIVTKASSQLSHLGSTLTVEATSNSKLLEEPETGTQTIYDLLATFQVS